MKTTQVILSTKMHSFFALACHSMGPIYTMSKLAKVLARLTIFNSLIEFSENDQVTFCCLLQHNVSCGRSQNYQTYKHNSRLTKHQNVLQIMRSSRGKTSTQNSMIDIDHSEGRITTKLMISKVEY